MANRFQKLLNPKGSFPLSFLRKALSGSFYKMSELRGQTAVTNIQTQIDTMRALALDSQISTALSYYATDATIPNTSGDVIWAVPVDEKSTVVSDLVNGLLKRWNVTAYARDHILELATIGNLYIPSTDLYKQVANENVQVNVALDNNTFVDSTYDIVSSYKIPPENVIHIYKDGKEEGYVLNPDDQTSQTFIYPESSIIHFSLGGLLGEYTITLQDINHKELTYDIKFAQPLMEKAVQPTQSLSLLEDALLLSSLSRVIRFIGVEVGTTEEEDEVEDVLHDIKNVIEQQISLNTTTGDIQSFVNPQSPNNLIYLPMINGQSPISITDLNMAETNDAESNLLNHYQDKKLSVLGVPKEAMNFSSNEGLGGAGSVLSQRSALYANALQRLETAYIDGWKQAINTYLIERNMSGMVDQYELRMQPIVTPLSTVESEKKDSVLSQAQTIVDLLQSLNVNDQESYKVALTEVLSETFPEISADLMGWDMNIENEGESEY